MSTTGASYRTDLYDGFEILIGTGDLENEVLTFQVAERQDFWLHVAGYSGSHVVVRNPDFMEELPRPVLRRAAELAAWYSKARGSGGKVEVHYCRASDVSKPRRFRKGQVLLSNWQIIKVYARKPDAGS